MRSFFWFSEQDEYIDIGDERNEQYGEEKKGIPELRHQQLRPQPTTRDQKPFLTESKRAIDSSASEIFRRKSGK